MAWAYDCFGNLYTDQGKLVEAEQMYKRALQGNEAALGAEHISTLKTVYNLGILYYNQGKLAKAEQMFERALQGRKAALGTEHTLTLKTVHTLGILYLVQGKLAKAKQMYIRELQGNEKGGENITTYLPVLNAIWKLLFISLFLYFIEGQGEHVPL
jgi:tetratricopeptide (TPR) repeat protein